MIKFGILTLGCKVNSYESEAIINKLCDNGYILVPFEEVADVYIINTCTVTQTSDQKSRQMLSRARRTNPSSIIVAMGCFSQLNKDTAEKYADIVIGTNNKLDVFELINTYLTQKKQINAITDVMSNPTYEEMKVSNLVMHTRAFIKIQDGCENYCSYCAIPYSRGKIRSRELNNVIDEINGLVNKGVKEVILSGINTGTYGQDKENLNLAKLLTSIMENTTIKRVRLSSIELMEITDELLSVLVKYSNRICHHLHIPLQGGSDGVLSRMHRKYNTLEYVKKINHIRSLLGDVALTTDVLAGFVGETIEEFEEAKAFIKRIGFFELHVFPYSIRKNTEAAKMSGHLDEGLKKERARVLIKIGEELKVDYINLYLGKTLEVLVETSKDGLYHGHTSNYLDVYFNGDELQVNTIVKVKLLKYDNEKIFGELEKE